MNEMGFEIINIAISCADGHIRKIDEVESEIIRMAILRYDGRMAEVARRLGIGRSTLYRKLKGFGMMQPDEKRPPNDENEQFNASRFPDFRGHNT